MVNESSFGNKNGIIIKQPLTYINLFNLLQKEIHFKINIIVDFINLFFSIIIKSK